MIKSIENVDPILILYKWIELFETVSCCLYIVALSCKVDLVIVNPFTGGPPVYNNSFVTDASPEQSAPEKSL